MGRIGLRHMLGAWEAFMEVGNGLGCAVVRFWSLEARAVRSAALSPRCCERARASETRASFH